MNAGNDMLGLVAVLAGIVLLLVFAWWQSRTPLQKK